jgi:hypothetical protein
VAGKSKTAADDGDFTNQPAYDAAAHGLDYGGDTTEYTNEAHDKAQEQGYFGPDTLPGEEIDGDLTVQGVADRDVVADQAEAKEEAAEATA